MFTRKPHAQAGRIAVGIFWVGLFLLLLAHVVGAQPTGYQEYCVLGYEEHIWRAFLNIYEGSPSDIPGRICSTVSMVATADHQMIYYDHWEDGYEADLLNPVQSTTEIHGDGILINGGRGNDILLAGDEVSLISDQNVTGPLAVNGYVPVDPARSPADIRYDGGDRIISSGGPVDLAHAMWPLGNSWVGGAWEIYSRQAYVDAYSYRLPIGEDLYAFGGGDTGTYGDFRNVYLQLGAFEDNTVVLIDNGTDVVNLTLDQGWTYSSMGYINSSPAPTITINAGTIIRSDKPTQVGLVTGADSRGGDGFQGRFLMVLSDRLWGADYVVPVPSGGTSHPAEVYLSNPNNFPIAINAYDAATQTTFVISPSGYISSTVPYSTKRGGLGYVPPDSAVRFTSSDGVFGVVVAADTSRITYDWGFAGIPAKYLTRDYYVSWAPGTTDLSDNGSPVWVTPLADDTTFFVDFSPLDGIVDQSFTLDVLQQRRIFDPDNDNTGTHIWATGEFAMSWGEDPRTAGPSDPYLDLGLATLPLLQRWLDPVLTLDKTADPTILPSSGGTVTFTLVAHSFNAPMADVGFTDTLPVNWAYVPNSTRVTYPDGGSARPEPTQNGRTLVWDLSTDLDVEQHLTLTFQAQINRTGSVDATAYDGFESGTYSGGANWAGNWQEGGDDGLPGSGDVTISSAAPFAGRYSLRIVRSNNSIQRAVNLSNFVLPTLRFTRRVDQLETGDHFYLDVNAGSGWRTMLTWTDGDLEGKYIREIVDLTPYAGPATSIRFRSGSSVGGSDYLYVDQVQVYDGIAASVNRGEAIGKDNYSGTLFSPTDEAIVYIGSFDLSKSVSDARAEIGDTLVYTLSYANRSTFITATNVTLRDALPVQHVTLQSASAGGTYHPASGAVIWSLGRLAPGANGTVTCTAQVNSFVEDGTVVENVAYLEGDQSRAGSNEVRTTILAPAIQFSKAGPAIAARGRLVTYTLSYRNEGGAGATGVAISDRIPPATAYVAGSLAINTGSGWAALSDAVDGDQGAFIPPSLVIAPGASAGTIAPGEAGEIRFSVRVEDELPLGSLILNSAVLDRDLGIPRDSNTVVTYIADLLLEKAAETDVGRRAGDSDGSQLTVAPGGVISYTLTYTNASATVAHTNVYIREHIPDHTSFIAGTAYGADRIEYSWDNGLTWGLTLPITPVTHIRWFDARVAPGTQGLAGFAVRVQPALPLNTTIRNTARITSTQIAPYLRQWLGSNQVEVGTVDLWVEKRVGRPIAAAGDLISYTIAYGNRGSADASGVRIQDTLPPGTTYSAGSIWGVGADDSGNPTLVWDVPAVMAGAGSQEAGYAVVLDVGLMPGTVVTNTAAISSAYGVKTSAAATLIISAAHGPPILSLDKVASADPVAPGEQFTYTLRVNNSGRMARGLVVSDVLPQDTSFVGCGGAPCALSGDTVVWGPLDLAGAGGTLNLTLRVEVDAGLPNGWTIVNDDYWLVAENAPPLSGPPVTTTVNVAALSLTKWAFPDQVFAGSRLNYSLLVSNSGGRAAHLVVSDTLPAHTTFGGCNCTVASLANVTPARQGLRPQPPQESGFCGAPFTCNLEGDQVVWRVDEMAGGRSLLMTFWVTVDAGLQDGALIVNDDYAVVADYLPPVVGSSPVTTIVRRLLVTVSKTAWPDPVEVGQELLFTIVVRNAGSLLQNVTVTDLLPAGVSYVGCGGALCELSAGNVPEVRWALSTLPADSEQQLTMRVLVEDPQSDTLVNEFYGAWIPAAGRRVMGAPTVVRVSNFWTHRLYLPLLFKFFP
jgi:uncharacterized repeat protein (TIGR01451 family)